MTKGWDYRVGGCPLAEGPKGPQITHVCVAEKTGRAWKTYYFEGTARPQELKPHAGLCFSKAIADEIVSKPTYGRSGTTRGTTGQQSSLSLSCRVCVHPVIQCQKAPTPEG